MIDKKIGNTKTTLMSRAVLQRKKIEDLAIEILEEKTVMCGQQVEITRIPGIFLLLATGRSNCQLVVLK